MPTPGLSGPPETSQPIAPGSSGEGEGNRIYFPGLDGLRALAIALVYLFHDRDLNLLDQLVQLASVPLALLLDPLLRLLGLPEVSFRLRGWVSPLRENGWIGVQLFFVLSGFLITTLLLRERERFGRVDLRAFWIQRALRIWPLYYLVILICFGLTPLARTMVGWSPGPWRQTIADHLPAFLVFLGNWSLVLGGPVPSDSILVLWSVCVEEQFYLFVPLLIAWSGVRWRVVLIVLLMAMAIASRYLLAASGASGIVLRFNTMTNLDTLLAGVLLAMVIRRWPGLVRGSPWFWRGAVFGGAWLVLSAPLSQGGPWRQALDYVLLWSWGSVLVAWAASDRDPWASVLRRRSLVWLGRISFGLYLYHEIAMGLVDWLSRVTPGFAEKSLLLAIFSPFLTIGLAAASYYGFERRFLRLKQRWTRVPSRPIDDRDSGTSRIEGTGDGIMTAPSRPVESPFGRS